MTLWKQDYLKSDLQKVLISNASRFQIPTVLLFTTLLIVNFHIISKCPTLKHSSFRFDFEAFFLGNGEGLFKQLLPLVSWCLPIFLRWLSELDWSNLDRCDEAASTGPRIPPWKTLAPSQQFRKGCPRAFGCTTRSTESWTKISDYLSTVSIILRVYKTIHVIGSIETEIFLTWIQSKNITCRFNCSLLRGILKWRHATRGGGGNWHHLYERGVKFAWRHY